MTTPEPPKCPYNPNQLSEYKYVFKDIPHQNIFLKFGSIITEWLSRLSFKSLKNIWFMAKYDDVNQMLYSSWKQEDLISKCRTLFGTVYITANPDIMKTIFQNPRSSFEGLFWDEQNTSRFIDTIMTDLYGEDINRFGRNNIAEMNIFTASHEYIKDIRAPYLGILGAGTIKEYIPQMNKIADDIIESLTEKEKMHCDSEKLAFEFCMTSLSKIIAGYDTTRENYIAFGNVILTVDRKTRSQVTRRPLNEKEQEEYQDALLKIKTVMDGSIFAPQPSVLIMKMKEAGWDDFKIRINLFFTYIVGITRVKASLNIALLQLAKPENKHIIEKLRDPACSENCLSQVIVESIRLHTATFIPSRQFRNDTLFEAYDASGKIVKKIKLLRNHVMLCPPPLAARDPLEFVNPLSFNPNRFNPDNVRSQLSWLPFGAGTHVCPGQYFALTELQVFISRLINKFDLELVQPDTETQSQQFSRTYIKLIDRYSH